MDPPLKLIVCHTRKYHYWSKMNTLYYKKFCKRNSIFRLSPELLSKMAKISLKNAYCYGNCQRFLTSKGSNEQNLVKYQAKIEESCFEFSIWATGVVSQAALYIKKDRLINRKKEYCPTNSSLPLWCTSKSIRNNIWIVGRKNMIKHSRWVCFQGHITYKSLIILAIWPHRHTLSCF